MTRRFLPLSVIAFVVFAIALMFSLGCEGGPPYGTPLYIEPGQDPFANPGLSINGIDVQPGGVNLAISGSQRFKAMASYNDGTVLDLTDKVEWYTESPSVGKFEPGTSKFLGQKAGVAIIRCRIRQGGGFAVSNAAFVNVFNPNLDNPPVIPQNPVLHSTPEGVIVSWDMDKIDTDLAGYNLYRTQVSTAHYAIDFDTTGLAHYASDHRLNDLPILYPPFLDKTVVSGWYYYRVTAEDILGLQSAPSEEAEIFITYQSHYGGAETSGNVNSDGSTYKDAFSTAF